MDRYLAVSKTAVGGLAACLLVVFALSSCSWFRSSDKDDNPKGEMRTADGAPGPKFARPKSTGQGAPDLASGSRAGPCARCV